MEEKQYFIGVKTSPLQQEFSIYKDFTLGESELGKISLLLSRIGLVDYEFIGVD